MGKKEKYCSATQIYIILSLLSCKISKVLPPQASNSSNDSLICDTQHTPPNSQNKKKQTENQNNADFHSTRPGHAKT